MRASTGATHFERRSLASQHWGDRDDEGLSTMHGDVKHSAWKPDTGEEASGGEWSSPNHPHRVSVHGGDFSQFEAESFEAESEAESFASTECPSIRLQQ